MISKIVLIGPARPFRGGISQFNHALADALENEGVEVEMITFSRQYPDALFPGKSQEAESGQVGDAVVPRLIDSINPFSWRKTSKKIVDSGADFVVFHYWMSFFAPSFGMILRNVRKRGIGTYAVVHNAKSHEKRPGEARIGRYFLDHCRALMIMSHAVGEDLHSMDVFAKQFYSPHPVYSHFSSDKTQLEARRHFSIDQDRETLLFFGLVREYKGLKNLLKALPEVVRQFPKVLLVVAGEFYDDPSGYYSIIEDNKLHNNVHIRDEYIPDEEVGDYFKACDIVVQPYKTATQSGVAQIAFNFNKPIIVTDVGGLAEIVPDGRVGRVVEPENPKKLAQAIVDLLSHDSKRLEMESAIVQHKKQFEWSSFAVALLKMMEVPKT